MLLVSVTANSGVCTNNFTSSLDDLRRLGNIVFLPPNKRVFFFFLFFFFVFEQWIFPYLRFGCDRNLSRIQVRANTTEGRLSPQLTVWEDGSGENTFLNINSTSPTASIGPNGEVIYTFEPLLAVTERQFIGFKFDNNGTDLTGHTIAFVGGCRGGKCTSQCTCLGGTK